jgi:hypothetical protein
MCNARSVQPRVAWVYLTPRFGGIHYAKIRAISFSSESGKPSFVAVGPGNYLKVLFLKNEGLSGDGSLENPFSVYLQEEVQERDQRFSSARKVLETSI